MIKKKDLLDRIKELENTLGLIYHKKETSDDYNQHVVSPHGKYRELLDLLKD